jgi:tetratricopeptide (TPR) repeat protein
MNAKQNSTDRSLRSAFALLASTALLAASTAMAAAQLPPEYDICKQAKLDPDRAIAACSQIIRSGIATPQNLAITYVNRGAAWSRKADYDRAIGDLDMAIKIEPREPRAYFSRANAFGSKGDDDRALADLNRAIEIAPSFAPAYAARGFILARKGELDRANYAMKLNPGLAPAYGTRAMVYLQKGEFDRALAAVNAAIRLDASLPTSFNIRGIIGLRKNEPDRALPDFNEAIQLDPRYTAAYFNRGMVRGKRREFDAAIADFSRAIEINPRYGLAYVKRGISFREKGELGRAESDFSEAIRLDPGAVEAFVNRALLREQQGYRERALADFAAALALDPRRKEALEGRSRLAAPAAPKPLPKPDAAKPDAAKLEASKPEFAKPPVAPARPGLSPNAANGGATPTPTPRPTAPAADATDAATGGNSSIKPGPSTPATPKRLDEALAACASLAHGKAPLAIEPSGGKGAIELPACYLGRRHLDCVVKAIHDEATAVDRDYGEIVRSRYSDIKDAKAICQIDAATIEDHLSRATKFDARAAALQKGFDTHAACMAEVRTKLGEVDLSAMRNLGELMESMFQSISEPIAQAAARQREVLRLVEGIETSRKAMETVRKIRGYICP